MGGGTWLNGKTRGGSGGLLSGGGEDGGMERSETDVFVSGSGRDSASWRSKTKSRDTLLCSPFEIPTKPQFFFMAGSCTAEANKAKPDGERLRQL